jgi:hypothetical protein
MTKVVLQHNSGHIGWAMPHKKAQLPGIIKNIAAAILFSCVFLSSVFLEFKFRVPRFVEFSTSVVMPFVVFATFFFLNRNLFTGLHTGLRYLLIIILSLIVTAILYILFIFAGSYLLYALGRAV